jgi:hypothetical protein
LRRLLDGVEACHLRWWLMVNPAPTNYNYEEKHVTLYTMFLLPFCLSFLGAFTVRDGVSTPELNRIHNTWGMCIHTVYGINWIYEYMCT